MNYRFYVSDSDLSCLSLIPSQTRHIFREGKCCFSDAYETFCVASCAIAFFESAEKLLP